MDDDRSMEYSERHLEAIVRSARATGWSGVIWSGEHGSGLSWHLEAAMQTLTIAEGPLVVRVHTGTGTVQEILDHVETSLGLDENDKPAVLFVIDDIDDLAGTERDELIARLLQCAPCATIIAAAVDSAWTRGGTHALKVVRIPKATPVGSLAALQSQSDSAVSPMVVGELNRRLGRARGSVIEAARVLTARARAGRRALPDPLPVTSSVRSHMVGWWTRLSLREREIAIAASVSIVDRVDVLLSATSSVVDALIQSPLIEHLDLVGGRFAFRDARARQFAHDSATLAQRTLAHERLGESLVRAGDDRAAWHRCLATLAGGAEHAGDVIALAETALLRGNSSWAFAAAREAASQAPPAEQPRALLVAGIAALNHGLIDDACDALNTVASSGDELLTAAALAPYIVAESARTGDVDESLMGSLCDTAQSTEPPISELERTALFVSGMLAGQRGDSDRAERYIRRAEQRCDEADVSVVMWRRLALLPDGRADVCHWQAAREAVSDLGAALFGETLRMLPGGASTIPIVHSESQCTPLMRAFGTVAHGCELLARGHIADARRVLTDAAFNAPIQVPFAGAGVSVLRRADAACIGAVGPTAASMGQTMSVPPDIEPDVAAVCAASDDPGRAVAALTRAGAPSRNRAPRIALDGVGILLSLGAPASEVVAESERCSHGPAALLCARLRLAPVEDLESLISECSSRAQGLSSLPARAQLEDAIADAYERRGDDSAHDRHRACADEFYERSGALVLSTRPIRAECHHTRAEWERQLTPREREVAKLVVLGLSNAAAAQKLGVSTRTIEVHLSRVFRKLSVRSRGELGYRVNTANPTMPVSSRAVSSRNAARNQSMSTMVTW